MLNDKRQDLELPEIVLASGSPRRAEILKSVGWRFRKKVPDVDESEMPGERPGAYVERLAISKSRAVAEFEHDSVVLGADTIVLIDGSIVGKPRGIDHARQMIESLSGRWHEVLTGVALSYKGETVAAVQTTKVRFNNLNKEEIDYLLEYGEPLDKAGGYAVQAQAALFIDRIEGDYWNVVGLPISLVYRLCRNLMESGDSKAFSP